jgi:hypothetical protein
MSLGSDSELQIWTAQTYWIPIGVAATIFLALTTYIGWQYQHRLRRRFAKLAASIDCDEPISSESDDENSDSKDLRGPFVFADSHLNAKVKEIFGDERKQKDDSLGKRDEKSSSLLPSSEAVSSCECEVL